MPQGEAGRLPIVILLVVAALIAVPMAWADRPTPTGEPPADGWVARWLPADGSARPVDFTTAGRPARTLPASTENGFGTRAEAAQALSLQVGSLLLLDDDGDDTAGLADPMWRQTVATTDPELPQPISVYGVQGSISLELDISSDLTAVRYRPGLPLLPAGVTAGDRWTAAGELRDLDGDRSYRADLTAAAAGDGCLTITAQLRIDGEPPATGDWRFCPGAGLVARTSDSGDAFVPGAAPDGTTAADRQPPTDLVDGLPGDRVEATWTIRTAAGSDRVMGTPRNQVDAVPIGTDRLVWANHAMRDLLIFDLLASEDGPSLVLQRRLHPGGLVLAAAEVGGSIVASTGHRTLTAWTASGVRLWSVRTDAVVHQPPIAVGPDTLAVIDGSGTVTAYDRATGARRWQSAGSAPITVPAVAADGLLLVADTGGQTRALYAETGATAWTVDTEPAEALGVGAGQAVVVAGGLAHGYRMADGRERWTNRVGGVARAVVDDDAAVVLAGTRDLVALTSTGAERWRVRRTCEQLIPARDQLICFDQNTGTVLDRATGATGRTVDIPPVRGDVRPLILGGRLWVLDANGWTAWTWGRR